jgi:hypothetical protein
VPTPPSALGLRFSLQLHIPPPVASVDCFLSRPPRTPSPEVTGPPALPTHRPPVPVILGGSHLLQHWLCRRLSHWHLISAQS